MAANDEKEDIQAEEPQDESVSEMDSGAKKKKKKRAVDAEAGPPKDKNKRVREQAARKMEEAKERAKSRAGRIGATGLDAGEMVDDAMARGFAAFTKWIKTNRRAIEFGIGGLILAGAGYATWDWYSTKTTEEASASLMLATVNASGVVEKAEDKKEPSEDDERLKDIDTRPRFDSYKAMREEALRTYRVAADEHAGTGAGILAELGEAGVLLERRDYDGAIKSLQAVLSTDLAKADESVRMAAKERMGMALEGKGDEAGAIAAYKELAASTLDNYKNLGLYHQARLSFDKGDKDEAKAKLLKIQERFKGKDSLKTTGADRYLTTQVDAMMRAIDPSATTLSSPMSPGGQLTPEKLKEIQKELEKMRQNAPAMEDTPPPKAPAVPTAPAVPSDKPEPSKTPTAPAVPSDKPEPPKAPAPPSSAEGK